MTKHFFVLIALMTLITTALTTGCTTTTYTAVRNPELIGVYDTNGVKDRDGKEVAGDLVYEQTSWGVFASGNAREAAEAQRRLIEANAQAEATREKARAEAELKTAKANVYNAYASNPSEFGPETVALLGYGRREEKEGERKNKNAVDAERMYNVAFCNVNPYPMSISIAHRKGEQLITIKSQEVAVVALPIKTFKITAYNVKKKDLRTPVRCFIKTSNRFLIY